MEKKWQHLFGALYRGVAQSKLELEPQPQSELSFMLDSWKSRSQLAFGPRARSAFGAFCLARHVY